MTIHLPKLETLKCRSCGTGSLEAAVNGGGNLWLACQSEHCGAIQPWESLARQLAQDRQKEREVPHDVGVRTIGQPETR